MGLYLAIDFGTSTNYIVRWDLKRCSVVPEKNLSAYGSSDVMDNSIYYGKKEIVIGNYATDKQVTDPNNLVRYIKTKIGNNSYMEFIPNRNKEMSSVDIASDIFKAIKDKVETNHSGENIEGVVITVPFAYLHKERQNIKKAAEKAGLNILALIEEPVAAAIKYIKDNEDIQSSKIMIFDLGGGTLDVTIFDYKNLKDKKIIEVINTDGHKALGGKYVDEILLDYIQKESGCNLIDILDEKMKKNQMRELLEEIKIGKESLSIDDCCNISLLFNHGKEIDIDLENNKFREILENNNFLWEIENVLDNVLEDVGLKPEDIDRVVMVGGSSQLQPVNRLIEEKLGNKIFTVDDPAILVGEGAGTYLGTILDSNSIYEIIPRLSQGIGIELDGKVDMLIDKNSKYGTESKILEYRIGNIKSDTEVRYINIYQGNSSDINSCSRVGTIEFRCSKFGERIGIKLKVDENGIIKYKLYTINDLLYEVLIDEGELIDGRK